jgi:hypothetical protein
MPFPRRSLALLLVVICGCAAGCSGGVDQAETATAATQPPPSARAGGGPRYEPALSLETPADAYPLIWVRVHRQVELRSEPGGGELLDRVERKTEWGSTSVFGVVRRIGDWAGVTTPLVPNGQLGWIKLDSDRLREGWTKMAIVVDLSDRRAALLRGGDPHFSFPVTVGMPGADTPTGRFAVTDAFRDDINPAYGCCALALSATQPHLPSGWLGGRRIAIHGTYGPLGVAASHGCVRAADDAVARLVDHVPLGAPVFIRP